LRNTPSSISKRPGSGIRTCTETLAAEYGEPFSVHSLRRCCQPEPRTKHAPFALDVVVEVRSPNERDWKVRAYLQTGTLVALDVMPDVLAIDAITLNSTTAFYEADSVYHDAALWLRFVVGEAFADLL